MFLMFAHLDWKALLVPRWSKSWQKQPTSSASCSRSVSFSLNLPLCIVYQHTMQNSSTQCGPWYKAHHKYGVHGLGDIEGMSPVVVGDWTIVLFDCQHPSIKHLTTQTMVKLANTPSQIVQLQIFLFFLHMCIVCKNLPFPHSRMRTKGRGWVPD